MIAALTLGESLGVLLGGLIAALLVAAIPVMVELRRRPTPLPEAEHTPPAFYLLPLPIEDER